MPDWEPFLTGLREAIGAAWPECLPAGGGGGIRQELDARAVPFTEVAQAGQLPIAVIDTTGLQPSPEWGGLARDVDAGDVVIYYVMGDDGLVASLLPRLRALEVRLRTVDLDSGQVIENPSRSISARLPLNNYFRNSKHPLQAGAVTVRVLVADEEEV